ncbi:MAG: hypothetical protein Q9183_005531 [Haloplaca sp. 2 TL-2023]
MAPQKSAKAKQFEEEVSSLVNDHYHLLNSQDELEELTAVSKLIDDDAAIRSFQGFLGHRLNTLVSPVREHEKGDATTFTSSVGALKDKLTVWEAEISEHRSTLRSSKGHIWSQLAD